MAITASLVKELRDKTNAGMMECKKALVEANGDIEVAIENMVRHGDRSDPSVSALERVAAGQERLVTLIETQGQGEGMDAESRMRLRSIDVQMLRILEEVAAGRQETMAELRTDLNAIARALDRMARNSGRRADKGEV